MSWSKLISVRACVCKCVGADTHHRSLVMKDVVGLELISGVDPKVDRPGWAWPNQWL